MTNYPTILGTGGHSAGNNQHWNTGTFYFNNVGLGRCPMPTGGITNELYAYQIARVQGAISYLSWGLTDGGGFPVGLTFMLRQNLSSSALAVSFSASTTGWMTDNSDSVSVSAGDKLDFAAYVAIPPGDEVTFTGSFYCASARFDSTDPTIASAQMIAATGPSSVYPTLVHKFVNFLGILGSRADADSNESNQQFKCMTAGKWQHMACNIESGNTYTDTTTVTNRKNNSNGAMSISIPAGHSGYFEDTTEADYDSVAVGDYLDYCFFGTELATGSFTIDWIGAHFLATDATLCMIGGSPTDDGIFETIYPQTYYSSLFGGGNVGNDTTRATGKVPYPLKASELTDHILSAYESNFATFTLMKNGNPTTLSVTSGAGQSGYFSAIAVSPISYAAGDSCSHRIVGAGDMGQAVTWAGAALLVKVSS